MAGFNHARAITKAPAKVLDTRQVPFARVLIRYYFMSAAPLVLNETNLNFCLFLLVLVHISVN